MTLPPLSSERSSRVNRRRTRNLWLSMSLGVLATAAPVSYGADTIASVGSLPALACRFESHLTLRGERPHEHTSQWSLWRQPDRVEVHDLTGESGRVWELNPKGQVTYQQVFHHVKRIIEYTPGDLRALNANPEWLTVATLINPALLTGQLQLRGEEAVLGRTAQRYEGRVNNRAVEVVWLVQEKIPALVRQVSPDREEVLRLHALYPLSESPWPRPRSENYSRLDSADLGDIQSDPFLRSLRSANRAPGHTH
jgi:hypothetical protein